MIQSIRKKEQELIILWKNGESSPFYYPWLLDNAPAHRHANGQKLTDTLSLDLDIRPVAVNWDAKQLSVQWKAGESFIAYPLEWLRQFSRNGEKEERVFWGRLEEIPTFSYAKVSSDDSYKLAWLESVYRYGFARLQGVPTEGGTLFEVVQLFGYIRETNYGRLYDVISRPDPENLADTGLGLAPHTDNPYRVPTPGIQLLHCLRADAGGGETILVDGLWIAQELRVNHPELFELLTQHDVPFQWKNEHHFLKNRSPLIGLDRSGNITYIRFNNRSIQPFDLPAEVMPDYYRAYQQLERMIHAEGNQLKFKLAPGDLIIFDNERLLHGRTAYRNDGHRHLQGCYAERDSLMSKIRTLREKLQLSSNKKYQL